MLKAKALDESPPQAIPVDTPPAPIPVDTPPAPIPVGPIPVQAASPAPIRIDPQATKVPIPLSPIPVVPASDAGAQVGPVHVGPNPAVAGAAPIVIDTGGRRISAPVAPAPRGVDRSSPGEATAPSGTAVGASGGNGPARPVLLTAEQRAKAAPRVTSHRGNKATGVREELDEAQEEGRLALVWRDFLNNQPSWLVSLVFHMAVLIVLGVLTLTIPRPVINLVSLPEPEELDFSELTEVELEKLDRGPEALDIIDRESIESLEPTIDMDHAAEGLNAASVRPLPLMTEIAPLNDHFFDEGRGTGTAKRRGTGKGDKGDGYGLAGSGQGLGGRGGRRGKAVGRGATPESEKAVNLALEWLAHHQLPDGGWSFDHTIALDCKAQCANPGEEDLARIGATALGVLPFLGAGQTHQAGQYKPNVKAALTYLMASMKIGREGGSLYDAGRGKMYSHGLATIALCEAYAMRMDPKELLEPEKKFYDGSEMPSPGEIKSLREKQEDRKKAEADNEFNAALGRAAQAALNFIVSAQHEAGGWRYEPRQAGDTSVVGWQLMALKSGQMAQLQVNPGTLLAADKYLQSVQIGDYGDDYGYTDPSKGTIATQAIGLLCRMYLGWPHDHPGLQKGVESLDGEGPSGNNMYYNYYATQVVHHYGGDPWKRWNPQMRDMLVARQSHNGHETGSWYFAGAHAEAGGRLYVTALAAMTLEVYYRHMPLYRQDIFGEGNDKEKEEAPKEEPEE